MIFWAPVSEPLTCLENANAPGEVICLDNDNANGELICRDDANTPGERTFLHNATAPGELGNTCERVSQKSDCYEICY